MNKEMKKNIWLDGMMGLIVGDALGIPVQFMTRREINNRKQGPVTGMEAFGTFNMPAGTWSDDSSMALATMASLQDKGQADLGDIMAQFVKWETEGKYTPFGFAFDQGNTCMDAIYRFINGGDASSCGSTGEYANGNGALMRILPACLYYYQLQAGATQQTAKITDAQAIEGVHAIAALTHNHLRSNMCCGTYYFMVKSILDAKNSKNELEKQTLIDILQTGINDALRFYGSDSRNLTQLAYLGGLFQLTDLREAKESQIRSSGYVIDSIEAAVWCLITTDTYKDCMLKAVNLGEDTDTIAAIAGGLAGLHYGYESIPEEWLEVIQRRGWIEEMCQ